MCLSAVPTSSQMLQQQLLQILPALDLCMLREAVHGRLWPQQLQHRTGSKAVAAATSLLQRLLQPQLQQQGPLLLQLSCPLLQYLQGSSAVLWLGLLSVLCLQHHHMVKRQQVLAGLLLMVVSEGLRAVLVVGSRERLEMVRVGSLRVAGVQVWVMMGLAGVMVQVPAVAGALGQQQGLQNCSGCGQRWSGCVKSGTLRASLPSSCVSSSTRGTASWLC